MMPSRGKQTCLNPKLPRIHTVQQYKPQRSMNTDFDIKNQTATSSVQSLRGPNQTPRLHKAQADDPYTLFIIIRDSIMQKGG
jgi:hypothetical protein